MNDPAGTAANGGPGGSTPGAGRRWSAWWPAVLGAVVVGVAAGIGLFALLAS